MAKIVQYSRFLNLLLPGDKVRTIKGKCQRYPYGFYYVPILDTIENLLRDPLFRRYIEHPIESKNNYYR